MPFKKQVYAGGGDLEIAWVEGVASSCTASEQ